MGRRARERARAMATLAVTVLGVAGFLGFLWLRAWMTRTLRRSISSPFPFASNSTEEQSGNPEEAQRVDSAQITGTEEGALKSPQIDSAAHSAA
jgi:hypothetical protein